MGKDTDEQILGELGGSEPSALTESTDWQAEYCRVHAELQGAYAEISSLNRTLARHQALVRIANQLRDAATGGEHPEFFDLSGDQPGN